MVYLRNHFCCIIFIFFCMIGTSYTLAIPESQLQRLYQVLEDKTLFSVSQFQGASNSHLKYLKFGHQKGIKGSIVFVHGLSENIYKYIELFYDLYLQGWSPIYTYDHRGQGFSEPLLKDSVAHYVEDYSFYREDLDTFIHLVLRDQQVDSQQLFLIAHSMGAAIVTDYFQTEPKKQIFKSIVFSSPLFGIATDGYGFVNGLLPISIRVICVFTDCLNPVVSENSRHISVEKAKKRMTHSDQRFQFLSHIAKNYLPHSPSYIPSYDWTLKTLLTLRKVMQKDHILKIQTPMLILQAKEDIVVSNNKQNQFCQILSEYCHIKVMNGRHEHFIEQDSTRNQAILEVIRFFQKY